MPKLLLQMLILAIVVPGAALCQDDDQTSNPRLQPIAYLVGGIWKAEGNIPGFGNFTAERSYEWTLEGQFIEQRHVMKLPNGEMETLGVIGWHPDKQAIAAWGFGSDGGFAETVVSSVTENEFQMEGARFADFNAGSIRSTFRKIGDHEFLEVAEIKKGEEWVEMFTFEFSRAAVK